MSRRPTRGSGNRGASRATNSAPTRKMEHIASVSRSSGLEKDGDALLDFKVQEEYRSFIQGKLNDLWTKHPRRTSETENDARQRVDSQENILILFRKLREGIISSKRVDEFSTEVYETSLCLVVLFDSPRQISSIVPAHLAYIGHPSAKPLSQQSVQTVLVSLLQQLVAAYPSQREFHLSLDSAPKAFFPDGDPVRSWVKSVAACIRTRNYARLSHLTQGSVLPIEQSLVSDSHKDLPREALYHLVDSLRRKTRDMAWTVIRFAYRELSCGGPEPDTRNWLQRSLGLQDVSLDGWLEQESGLGHVRRKEEVEGRWILCKPR
ncbi:hypothetical protein FB45DRAFT_896301 [Roridomyces roridus]|uniref:Uncharacterized protein n=1 Tax=Roridomyces roridus TaxID=1738132 RepID=A0AAD7FY47_9AGAR|nr:hypothetical protein FB45DRAFT_896301 [Roridomyces roridus]